MTLSFQPYRPRAIRFLELWSENGWRVKVYGICAADRDVGRRFVEAAKEIARRTLPQPPVAVDRYGAACLTIHTALMFHQIILDWWERENEMRHHVFKVKDENRANSAPVK